MRTIRRIYLYAVAFISLLVITWGLIGLARSAFSGDGVSQDTARLAGALALIFVGIPVFLLHWGLAQRSAYQDNEDRGAYIRAFFLYGVLLATLIPITQNLMALLNRGVLTIFDLQGERAILGFGQTWSDNLIAALINGLIAVYIFRVLRKDWTAQPAGNAFAETRRLYRYIWMIYGLGLMVSGVQQTLLFIFDLLIDTDLASPTILGNGLTLILAGTPLWIYSWRVIQKSTAENILERGSMLRGGILLLVNLVGLVVTLFAGGHLLVVILSAILGSAFTLADLLEALREPFASAIPFGLMWAYFSSARRQDLAAEAPPQLRSKQQFYTYLSAFLGLTAFLIGLQQLTFFIIRLWVTPFVWSDLGREALSLAIANLVFGLPLWLYNWRKVNRRAGQEAEVRDLAQNPLTRRIYLYLILFIGVMGLMFSVGALVFQVLQALFGNPDEHFGQLALELVSLLILFALFSGYHGRVLRADGRLADQNQAAGYANSPILVLVTELGAFSQTLVTALAKEAPTMPVAVHVIEQGVPDEALSDAKAVILPAEIAANAGEAIRLWLQNFSGTRFVIPMPVQGWVWVPGNSDQLEILVRQTVAMVRQLAEGEDLVPARAVSPWLIGAVIIGGIFGVGFLLLTVSILIDVLN